MRHERSEYSNGVGCLKSCRRRQPTSSHRTISTSTPRRDHFGSHRAMVINCGSVLGQVPPRWRRSAIGQAKGKTYGVRGSLNTLIKMREAVGCSSANSSKDCASTPCGNLSCRQDHRWAQKSFEPRAAARGKAGRVGGAEARARTASAGCRAKRRLRRSRARLHASRAAARVHGSERSAIARSCGRGRPGRPT